MSCPRCGDEILEPVVGRDAAGIIVSWLHYCRIQPDASRRLCRNCLGRLSPREQNEILDRDYILGDIPRALWDNCFGRWDSGGDARMDDLRAQCLKCAADPPRMFSLIGETGRGKTFAVVSILQEYLMERSRPWEVHRGGWRLGKFCSARSLLVEIRRTFDTHDDTEADIIEDLARRELLVLDDIFHRQRDVSAKDMAFEARILYDVLDRRINAGKSTIVTSNRSLASIADIDDALVSRMRLGPIIIMDSTFPDRRPGSIVNL